METTVDTAELRRALGAFATGVTIVTAVDRHSGEPVGFTANSFTSVSLDPPLVLVCLAHTAASYAMFCASEGFAVNVLTTEQEGVARTFAKRGAEKFANVAWHPGRLGAPLLEGCLARFDCAMHERFAAGDHDVLFGRVVDFACHDGRPLLYHGGNFAALG